MLDIPAGSNRIWPRVTHDHRRGGPADGSVTGVQTPSNQERDIDLAELGDALSALRLCDASAIEVMRRSFARHGPSAITKTDPPVLTKTDPPPIRRFSNFVVVAAAQEAGAARTGAGGPRGVEGGD